MALDINASLATFKMFTDFAQQRVDEGKGKAIARDEEAAQFTRFGMNGPGFMSV